MCKDRSTKLKEKNHVSCVACNPTITICSFSFYESPRFLFKRFREELLWIEVSTPLQENVTPRGQTHDKWTLQLIDWIGLGADSEELFDNHCIVWYDFVHLKWHSKHISRLCRGNFFYFCSPPSLRPGDLRRGPQERDTLHQVPWFHWQVWYLSLSCSAFWDTIT